MTGVNTRISSMRSKCIALAVFGIAMGFLEAVVVVYLRQLYYPEGFAFPLKFMPVEAYFYESLREISTLVMLVSVSILAGRGFYERLAYFLYCFGIWDIFYYVWLKVLLDWPQSLLTWDILFLIPVVWVGPVLAPILCSVTIIVISGCILRFQHKGYRVRISLFEWILLSSGALITFSTFVMDYSKVLMSSVSLPKILTAGNDPRFQKLFAGYVPASFNWPLFFLGEGLVICFLLSFRRRMKG